MVAAPGCRDCIAVKRWRCVYDRVELYFRSGMRLGAIPLWRRAEGVVGATIRIDTVSSCLVYTLT